MRVLTQLTAVAAITVLATACGETPTPSSRPGNAKAMASATPAPREARAVLQAREGTTAGGTVTFTEVPEGVRVHAEVHGVSPGEHGIHLHEAGDCSAPDFSSAGGHFNPTGAPHGGPASPEHHAGDFGNIVAGEDGSGTLDLVTPMLTIEPGPESVLGKAVVLHADQDDLTSQPSGASGERIACGVVSEVVAAAPATAPQEAPEAGDCSAPDFSSAGGHFNPTGAPHGGPASPEHHAGDFGNIVAGEDGSGTLDLVTPMLTIEPGPDSVLGKAVVLDADQDDLTSQPTGASGERIACGVVSEVAAGAAVTAPQEAPGAGASQQ